MKKKHLLATLLVLVLVVSIFSIPTSAYYRDFVRINVDGSFIYGVSAYLGDDGDVRVSTGEDLLKIFPKELKNTVIAYDPQEGILVEEYINDFGYDSRLLYDYRNSKYPDYTLYIYTGAINSRPGSNWPGITFEYPEVYINGFYISASKFDQYWNTDFSKYQIISSGNRIYLNNDGGTPVEVVVDGELIHFPGQQPIIMKSGKVMMPIRKIAEMLGFNVDWDAKQNCAIITHGKNTMYIYPGDTRYLFNGKYYTMDIKPVVRNGKTLVSLPFIAERFGYSVDFESDDILTVFLNS